MAPSANVYVSHVTSPAQQADAERSGKPIKGAPTPNRYTANRLNFGSPNNKQICGGVAIPTADSWRTAGDAKLSRSNPRSQPSPRPRRAPAAGSSRAVPVIMDKDNAAELRGPCWRGSSAPAAGAGRGDRVKDRPANDKGQDHSRPYASRLGGRTSALTLRRKMQGSERVFRRSFWRKWIWHVKGRQKGAPAFEPLKVS